MSAPVSAVVINWNGLDDSKACLRSLLDNSYDALSVIVIDNGSNRDEAALLKAEFPASDAVRLPDNLGYAAACNVGLERAFAAGARYACILNNDTTVSDGFFEALTLASARTGDRAIVAPMILDPSGRVWSAGGTLHWPNLAGEHIGLHDVPAHYEGEKTVDWASGCALLISEFAFRRSGPMDERFFLYLEDIDWCLQAQDRGLSIVYAGGARLTHGINRSVRAIDRRLPRYYAYRNFYLLGFRHGNRFWQAWLACHLAFTLSKCGLRNLLFDRYRRDGVYNARTRALLDVVRRRFGKAPYSHEPLSA
jgi:GT2 family glycosyltransferase